MSLYSRLDRLAADVEKLNKQVTAVSNQPQSQRISVEGGGSFDFNDADGNLMAVVGGQDDGSNTIRHVDGPTPPIPSGLSAHVDGPIVQVSWDGTFEDADNATYDWSHLEVIAVGPDNTNLRATINDVTGATANLAATASGEWTVAARSVSRAEKRSLDGDAGTVEVKLVDIDGAIEAVQDSANGKNKVTYSDRPPTPADPGIFDDTWFVGQVGRPNDIVEATNMCPNPSFELAVDQVGWGSRADAAANIEVSPEWSGSGSNSLKVTGNGGRVASSAYYLIDRTASVLLPGKTYTVSATARLSAPMTGTLDADSRSIVFGTRNATSGAFAYTVSKSTPLPNVAGAARLSHTFTVPVGFYGFIRLINGSSTSSIWWDAFDVAEVVAARPYFDGDTPNGSTDNESHYRWTGTPHASTSEKYLPALTIGESDSWNITEQYRHDGSGWVRVELSHKVFSSVDLGKATVGELDGIRIMARTVGTEQLRADFADFVVARGATLIAGNDRHRLDDSGYAIFDTNGDRRTFLSPEGSTFKGEVEADTLVVNGGAELRGDGNVLAHGAKLTLAAGVTDPTAPPIVQPYWEGLDFEFLPATANSGPVGLAWDGTNFWTVNGRAAWLEISADFRHAVRINGDTGATTYFTLHGTVATFDEMFGVTCVGDELFWLYRNKYDHRVVVTDLNCEKKREFVYPDAGHSATNPLTYRPGIGNDGTNIVIVHATDAGGLRVRTYNKTTGTQVGSTVSGPDDTYKSDTTGVYVGSADDGATRIYVQPGRVSHVSAYTTSGAYDTARRFGMAAPGSVGVVFADGKFHTLDPAGVIHEYTNANTGDDSGDWWACYAWGEDFDSNGIVETWSRPGPSVRFEWPRRAKLKFLGQPLPDGAQMMLPAVAKKATTPTRTDFHSPTWRYVHGRSVAYYDVLPSNWETYPSPRGTNNFPEGLSSSVESASGTFQVRGDGSGHWGPLTMGRNGVMSGLIVTGQVVITPDAANVSKLATVTLPPGRFTRPPVVWVSVGTSVPHRAFVGCYQPADTNTFDVYLNRDSTTTTGVQWYAMDGE